MSGPISGPGIGLGLPQALYPTELGNAPYDLYGNYISLNAGDELPIPAGVWGIYPGKYSMVEYLDPVTGIWRFAPIGYRGGMQYVKSDGFNVRVANRLGCAVAAVVTNAGTGYVQASTTVTASAGGSLWQPIVGGMVTISSITAAGAGYGVAPLVFIPAPPAPGVQATAYAAITSGTVSSLTMLNNGAGYTTAPPVTILPNPTDPNINAGITAATGLASLFGSGSIAAVLCTNPGSAQATAPTLAFAGVGSSAAATLIQLLTLTGASIFGAGTGITTSAVLTTVGGVPSATPATSPGNPEIDLTKFLPRPAQAGLANSGGSLVSISTIYDGGLFVGTPTVLINLASGSIAATGPSIAGIYGSTQDTVVLQPFP